MVELSLATKDDVDTVVAILEDNERWMAARGIDQWPLNWHRRRRQEISQWANDGCLYLAKQGDAIVGTIATFETDEKYWGSQEERALYFHKLAIGRTHSGKDLGQDIIERVRELARSKGKKKIRLSCLRRNAGLNQYYRSLGFVQVGTAEVDGFVDNLYELTVSS